MSIAALQPDHITAFAAAMADHRLITKDPILDDGQLHRFHVDGDKLGTLNGWYCLYGDSLPAGAFGNWKADIKETWCAKSPSTLSETEKAEYRHRMEQARQERDRERLCIQQEAAQRSQELWERADPNVMIDHPYLVKKNITAHGIRQLDEFLVVPIRDAMGQIKSLQFIDKGGNKRFKSGGHKQGGYHSMGKPSDPLYICEGLATASTVFEATGKGTVVAFDAGNLELVAKAINSKFPNKKIIIAADNDHQSLNNPGLSKAATVARELGLTLVYPRFEAGQEGSDWNDYAVIHGLEATRKALTEEVVESPVIRPDVDWPEPQPLSPQLMPVEPFSPKLLPEPLQDWVQDVSERKDKAPLDYAAVGTMVALGAILGRKVAIHPKRHDDWVVVPNLWGGVVGRPSMKKTPTLEESISPIRRLEAVSKEDFDAAAAEYQVALKLDKLQQKETEYDAAKLIKEEKHSEAHALLLGAAENVPQPPSRRRYILNNATVEKLGEILSENPMGILQYRDELIGWLNSLDREDRGEDRAFYLEAWNGAGRFTYDRIGRGTVDIESCTVSVLGGIQPGKLQPYLLSQRRGDGDDGLIERLQLMVYPDPNRFKHVDRCPNTEAKNQAHAVFNKFAAIPDSSEEIPILRFSDDAQDLFDEWYCDLSKRAAAEPCRHIESHLCKYASLMPSLALIIHVAQQGIDSAVGLDAAMKAAAWCEYLESHARRIYALADDPLYGARSLAKHLRALPNPFQTKHFSSKGWSGLNTPAEIHQALATLCEMGYLHPEETKTETKPKVQYYINPTIGGE